MEYAEAKLSDIQARLGHSSIAKTGEYLVAMRSDENPYCADVAAGLGITH